MKNKEETRGSPPIPKKREHKVILFNRSYNADDEPVVPYERQEMPISMTNNLGPLINRYRPVANNADVPSYLQTSQFKLPQASDLKSAPSFIY